MKIKGLLICLVHSPGGKSMTDEEIMEFMNQIISETVNKTVLKLRLTGFLRDDQKTNYQKTEDILKNYNHFSKSNQPFAKKLVEKVDDALKSLEDDKYFEIVPLYFFKKWTREAIAEYFDTSTTTISRNKNRLVNQISIVLFADDYLVDFFRENK